MTAKPSKAGHRLSRRAWVSGSATMLGTSWLHTGCGGPPPAHPKSRSCPTVAEPLGNWVRSFKSPLRADAHCHCFNALDLPIDGFARSLAHGNGVPTFADSVIKRVTTPLHKYLVDVACNAEKPNATPAELRERIDSVSKSLESKGVHIPAAGIQRLARVASSSRRDVLVEMAKTFPEISLFMPALVDYGFWEQRGRRRPVYPTATTLADQVKVHGSLFLEANSGALDEKAGRKGNAFSVHGYVPFNPLRQVYDEAENQDDDTLSAMDVVKKAIGIDGVGLGFVGVKLYPASGFLPIGNARLEEFGEKDGTKLDDTLKALYKLCQDNDIPILAHAADSNGFAQDYGWRGTPFAWREVLAEYPNLRLNLGHFGQMRGLEDKTCVLSCLAWAEMIAERLIVPEYPNVYADLSFSAIIEAAGAEGNSSAAMQRKQEYVERLKEIFERHPETPKRLLYGTDWWMTELETTAGLADGKSSFFTATEAALRPIMASHLDAFSQTNVLQYLGILDAKGAPNQASAAQKRLVDYYTKRGCRANALPPWLHAEAQGSEAPNVP